jgi:hypothetical protein
LGEPERVRRFVDQYFLQYFSLGVDVDFGTPSGKAKQLVFYDAGVEGHTRRAPVRLDGIRLHAPKSRVIKLLGKPDREGGLVMVAGQGKTWIYYAAGLQLDFDSDDRLIIIIVFDPELDQPLAGK